MPIFKVERVETQRLLRAKITVPPRDRPIAKPNFKIGSLYLSACDLVYIACWLLYFFP